MNVKKIALRGKQGLGLSTLVDEADFAFLNQFKWYLSSKGYVVFKNGKYTTFMHRLVNKTPAGLQTDHINRNKLDNRKLNLRTVTNQQNHFNMPLQKNNTSGHPGVSYNTKKEKYMAFIGIKNKIVFLGWHKKIKNAINARKVAEKEYHYVS